MPAQISIQLAQPAYRPGEAVHGTLHLTAHSDLRPRDIVLHAFGEEVTMLGPNSLMTERTHVFELAFSLWSPTAHDDKLPKGEYDFPFEFALPAGLAPSFNGEFTRIVYLITGKIDLPLHADIRHEQALHVLPPIITELDQPVTTAAEAPGLKIELQLNGRIFYPGDHLTGTLRFSGAAPVTAAQVEIVSREKGEAREFTDHFDKVRVRAEIDPARLIGGQPFPIDLPLPEDADPSFVGQHSAKSRLVRATFVCLNRPPLIAEAGVIVGIK
jgi:hypothetical protein